jgi:uncharacterized lipoprotein YajG
MRFVRRLTASAVVFALMVGSNASTACTSMRTIKPVTNPGDTKSSGIKAGDTVSIRLKDGREEQFVVHELDSESLTSAGGVRYTRADITELKLRSSSPTKTILLITGVSAGVLLIIGAIAFATWDGPFAR